MVKAILASPGIKVINGNFVARALDFYISHNIDFIDGYMAAVMEKRKVADIYSFDRKHLGRIKTITERSRKGPRCHAEPVDARRGSSGAEGKESRP
jgi:hypothetical protein